MKQFSGPNATLLCASFRTQNKLMSQHKTFCRLKIIEIVKPPFTFITCHQFVNRKYLSRHLHYHNYIISFEMLSFSGQSRRLITVFFFKVLAINQKCRLQFNLRFNGNFILEKLAKFNYLKQLNEHFIYSF